MSSEGVIMNFRHIKFNNIQISTQNQINTLKVVDAIVQVLDLNDFNQATLSSDVIFQLYNKQEGPKKTEFSLKDIKPQRGHNQETLISEIKKEKQNWPQNEKTYSFQVNNVTISFRTSDNNEFVELIQHINKASH